MRDYIGFTTITGLTESNQNQFQQIMARAINWSEESNQFHRAKYEAERDLMMHGFYPRQFITESNNINDSYFEEQKEEEKKEDTYGFLFYGYHQKQTHIINYEPNKQPRLAPYG